MPILYHKLTAWGKNAKQLRLLIFGRRDGVNSPLSPLTGRPLELKKKKLLKQGF